LNTFDRLIDELRCEAALVELSVTPLYAQPESKASSCQESTDLPTKMAVGGVHYGELTYDTNSTLQAVTYLDTKHTSGENFFFYYHLDYDSTVEGPLEITLQRQGDGSIDYKEVTTAAFLEG
jgi:hypothetical protein